VLAFCTSTRREEGARQRTSAKMAALLEGGQVAKKAMKKMVMQ
jgi:hypothetical protein